MDNVAMAWGCSRAMLVHCSCSGVHLLDEQISITSFNQLLHRFSTSLTPPRSKQRTFWIDDDSHFRAQNADNTKICVMRCSSRSWLLEQQDVSEAPSLSHTATVCACACAWSIFRFHRSLIYTSRRFPRHRIGKPTCFDRDVPAIRRRW
jgi:hypothetical protein